MDLTPIQKVGLRIIWSYIQKIGVNEILSFFENMFKNKHFFSFFFFCSENWNSVIYQEQLKKTETKNKVKEQH